MYNFVSIVVVSIRLTQVPRMALIGAQSKES
jgi:hypothetical protein